MFIWGKGHGPSAERLKIQQDLFGFSKVIKHGFPHKPTSMAYDPKLKLLAVGTKQGLIRVYGRPGVEFYGRHEDEVCVTKILFLPGHGRLVTLTDDNTLHLWETPTAPAGECQLVELKSAHLEGRLKQVSQMCLDLNNRVVLLGTEGGNIYQLNLWTFSLDENIIYQDVVMQNAPDDFKVNPGAVEGLLLHPDNPDQVLIGYARGLMVLWDRGSGGGAANGSAVRTFVANQQLEGLSWRSNGDFVSIHNDGFYILWSQDSTECTEPPNNPYGPYPCKAFTKVVAFADLDDTNWMLFSGGMARASYGDRHTVTLMKGDEKHTVFDLTSKVNDFLVVYDDVTNDDDVTTTNKKNPSCLLILAEEEIVAIDLKDDAWPTFNLPYLNPIHASSITCMTHVPDVDNIVMSKITAAATGTGSGGGQNNKISSRPWPINGGRLEDKEVNLEAAAENDEAEAENEATAASMASKDLLVTGHEDGSVKFWACSEVALTPLATVNTKQLFVGNDLDEPCAEEDDEEDEWPPFKKVGHFDPFSDDPSMAVRKVSLCPQTGRLFVGGTAGQVVIFDLNDVSGGNNTSDVTSGEPLELVKADLVTEKEGFTWKGHPPLKFNLTKEVRFAGAGGFQVRSAIQISPPASVNSLGFSSEWNLLAVGTAHGLVVFDTLQNATVTAKCTLNAQDIANADDNPMSRRKSLKKSLRESFRRLRKGRSQRNNDKKKPSTDTIKRDIPNPRSESPEHCR